MSNQQDLSIEQMQQHVTQILAGLQMLGLSDRRCKKQLQILMERYQSLLTESWEKLLQDCADFCQSNNNFIAKKRVYRLRPWIRDKKSFDYLQWQYIRSVLPVGRDYMNDPDYMSPGETEIMAEELLRLEKIYLPEILHIAPEKLPRTEKKAIAAIAPPPTKAGTDAPRKLAEPDSPPITARPSSNTAVFRSVLTFL